ncbi:Reticulocyte-binding protein 2-like protein a [Diplonema papillatum]|nr:Reticulocyte-binding protein 2-like protein a [Diplonema papillatum]
MDDLAEVAALRARVKELEDAAFDMECAKNAEIGRLNERMAELQFERSLMPVREMLTQTPYSRRLLDPSQERAGGPAAETSSISQASARSADACASQLLVHDGGGEHGTATGDTSMADDGPAKRSDPYLRGLGEMQVLVATMQRAITAQQSFREAQLVNTGKGSAGESEEADGGKVRALLIEVAMLAEEKAGLADKLTAAEGKARAIAEQWNAAADAARERIEALEASVAELAKANADLQHARPHPSQAPDGNHGQLQDMAAPPNTPEPRGSSVASPVANCLSSPPNGAAMLTPSNSPAPAGDCLRQQQLRQQQQEKEEKEDQLAALTAAVAEKQEELRSAHASIGAVREAAERLQREQEEEAGCRLQQQQLQQQQREKEAAADEEMEGGVRAEQQQQQQQQQQEELQEKYVGALQRLAEAEKQVAEQVDAVSALHGERDELHREVNEAAQRYEELQRAVEAKEQELTGELSRTREAAAQAAEADAATKEALRAQAAALQAALDGTSAKHAALDAELAGVLQQCEAESKRANALTGEIAGVKASFERVTGSKPLRGVKLLTGEATSFERSQFSRTEETAVRQLRAVVAGVLGVEAAAVSSLVGWLLLSFWQLHKKAPEVVAAEMARLNIDYDTDLEETSEEDTEDIEDETPIAGGVEDAHRTASAGRGTGLRPPGVPHARPVSRSRSPPITPPPVDNAIIALIERMEKDRKAEMAELRAEIAQLKKAPPAPRATPDAAQSRANSQASENGDALPSVRGGESDYSEGGISVDAPRETVLLDPAFWVNMDRAFNENNSPFTSSSSSLVLYQPRLCE